MKQGDFTQLAKHYHNRPAYSTKILEKLIKCINDKNKSTQSLNVIEIGAGTGKLTKMLANFSLNVVAVEPNDAMREEGIKYTQHTNVKWQKGSGENSGIESNIADWVIMASSFHWTDPNKSLPEFARILKNGGYFSAIWNPRDIKEGSVFAEIEEEIHHIVPELKRVSSGEQNVKNWNEILESTGHFKDCFFMECSYTEMMDKSRYMGAWHSVNDIQAQAGKDRWRQILTMIESKIQHMNIIEIPYTIKAWSVKKKS